MVTGPDPTVKPSVVDLHAHFMPSDLPDLAAETGDVRWPKLWTDPGGASGHVLRGSTVFRVVRRPCWDAAARIEEMDRLGVDIQVISPMPVALTYWADADTGQRYARHINDWLARTVSGSSGRLRGLGTVPLQHPDLAIAEMVRCVRDLNLDGLELGTVVGAAELDSSDLRAFFAAAEDLSVPLFIHPIDGDRATRASSPDTAFGIGMLTDTALAANALIFGGVMSEFPGLCVCFAHGGGAFPWLLPRLKFGRSLRDPGSDPPWDELTSRCYVDAVVFDPVHLDLLKRRFGASHIVAGSDYPFLPDGPAPQEIIDEAARLGVVTGDEATAMKGSNALLFLEPNE